MYVYISYIWGTPTNSYNVAQLIIRKIMYLENSNKHESFHQIDSVEYIISIVAVVHSIFRFCGSNLICWTTNRQKISTMVPLLFFSLFSTALVANALTENNLPIVAKILDANTIPIDAKTPDSLPVADKAAAVAAKIPDADPLPAPIADAPIIIQARGLPIVDKDFKIQFEDCGKQLYIHIIRSF